jgi:hypothetical protein
MRGIIWPIFWLLVGNCAYASDAVILNGVQPTAVLSAVGEATVDRPVSSPNAVQISAGQGNGNATIKVSGLTSSAVANDVGTFTNWSLLASAPLSKSSDTTEVSTLDGLTNAATLQLQFSQIKSYGVLNPSASQEAEDEAICARAADAFKLANKSASVPDCDENFVKKYDPGEYEKYKRTFWAPVRQRVIWGFSGKVGYQSFQYVQSATLSSPSVNKVPWSAGAYFSWNPDAGKMLYSLNANYQDAFKDAKSGVLCPSPSPAGGNTKCVSGPLGVPVSSESPIVSAELRKAWASVGATLTASYDLKQHITGLDLPVYFIKSATGALTGGLRLGWRSDTHTVTAGIFVASTFNLLSGISAGGAAK